VVAAAVPGNVTGVGDDGQTGDRAQEWRRQRELAVQAHAADAARRLEVETAQARRLVADFAVAARERRLRPTALVARGYSGRGRYRTGLHGWYLRPDIAVGTDGEFYLLTVPDSVRGRLVGATVRPAQPRLVVGEGARDGERIALSELLDLRLAAGDDWPS
jgi:hypothetical protein